MIFGLNENSQVDQYTIIRLIDQGGMGSVYEALDKSLNRKVALKFMAEEFLDNEDMKLRFETEAKATARVQHVNVVSVYSIGQYQGIPYIAMEFVEGKSFHDLKADRDFSFQQAYPYFKQMLEGVNALHKNGIIHRDLKPKNMICKKDGTLKIVDFGIAKMNSQDSQQLTQVGTVMGSGFYMAPEIVLGKTANSQADIRSLGVIFYEVLVGSKPFKSKEYIPLLEEIAGLDIVFPKSTPHKVSVTVQMIVCKMCERSLTRRYEKIDHVLNDINAAYATEKQSSLNSSGLSQTHFSRGLNGYKKTQSKHNWLWVGVGAFVLSLMLSGGYYFYNSNLTMKSTTDVNTSERSLENNELNKDSMKELKDQYVKKTPVVVAIPPPVKRSQKIKENLLEKLKNTSNADTNNFKNSIKKQKETQRGTIVVWPAPKTKSTQKLFILNLDHGRRVSNTVRHNTPLLSWRPERSFDEFLVEISKDKNFKTFDTRRVVKDSYYYWDNYKPGYYYWRVKGRSPGVKSGYSSIKSFQVLTTPPLFEGERDYVNVYFDKKKYLKDKIPLKLIWSQNPFAKSYKVSFNGVERATASINYKKNISKNELQIKLARPGRYKLSVLPLDIKGHSISRSELQESISIFKELKLHGPQLMAPRADTMSKMTGSYSSVWLKWKAVRGAKSYEIQFSRDPVFGKVLFQQKVALTKFFLKRKFTPGPIYWRVKAEGYKLKSEWSEPFRFMLVVSKSK